MKATLGEDRTASSRTRTALLAASILTLALIVPAFVQAKPAKVSGKLSARGYTVIALAASCRAKTDRAARKFKLRPPTKNVTLQLRAPDGTYGPIVVAEKEHAERAIVGTKAGAKLGEIEVNRPTATPSPQRGSPASTSTSSARLAEPR